MKSWKTRLSVTIAMLAIVLVASVPAVADDIEVECEADDGGFCKKEVTVSSYEDDDLGFEGEAVEGPFIEGTDSECYPFCGLDWWPW